MAVYSVCLHRLLSSAWYPHSFSVSLWELRGQGGTNSLRLVREGCCSLFARCRNVSLPSKAHLFSFFSPSAFMSQVHYFVIINNPKSRGRSYSLWKLNIAFKSQFPWWDYANQPVPVSSCCFHSWLIHPPPWCISSFAVVYPIHLKTSFSTPDGATHVFHSPLCIVTSALARLRIRQLHIHILA